ncbi:hypothetical protein ACLHDG_05140 [Sulfurovum sp. CS9]|uniref:hypothetical protein n=1 Tax=Sulfurovum sp. CS9 TaxID=3391146 RepID=UPI0039EA9486
MKRLFLSLIVMLLCTAGVVNAHTSGMVEKTCPLCEKVFKYELDMSGTQFGMRLDLKPLGPTAAPWRIPVCPRCHFVLYDDEIPTEELAKCKKIIQSDAYKKQSKRASYYLLGLLFEGLKKNPLDIAHIFLKASWQEESDEKKLKDDLEHSIHHFELFLKEQPKSDAAQQKEDNAYVTAQLMKGEILRRLSHFEEAKSYFSGLLLFKPFKEGTFLRDIVRFEISLCDKKDSGPHAVSEVKKERNSEPVYEDKK